MEQTIGLTLGDPSGIGPELWVRVLCGRLNRLSDADGARLRLFGDAGVLARAAQLGGLATEWRTCLDKIELVPVTSLSEREVRPGQPTAASGRLGHCCGRLP